MSKPKVFEKPIGVKDYLPHAVAKLRQIENQVLACMESWGYEQIMTPTMEYYDTVGVASSTSDQKLFKLLNNRGTTLVLRSDMTAPIARVVSSLLKESQFPISAYPIIPMYSGLSKRKRAARRSFSKRALSLSVMLRRKRMRRLSR